MTILLTPLTNMVMQMNSIPEPMALLLLGTLMIGWATLRRRTTKS